MYKIELDNEQIQIIYNITDNKDKQSKLMSVLSYLIKYTDVTTNKLTKSLSTLYKMYCRLDYRKISNCYFFKLVDLLEEHNLYTGERRKSKTRVSEIVSEKVSEKKVPESVENTDLEGNFEKHNNLITKSILYTYTLNTAKAEKVAAIDLVEDVMKDLKIKSKVIKQMVMSKIKNIELDSHGAVAYLIKVIAEKVEQYNIMRNNYTAKVAESKRTYTYSSGPAQLRFNNFDHREIYDDDSAMKSLENKLLGWDK